MPKSIPATDLDVDMAICLAEYGTEVSITKHRQEAGERANAALDRITGSDVNGLLDDLPDAMMAAGWDPGGALMRYRVVSGDHSNPGREWVLRGALADARITATIGGNVDPELVLGVLRANQFPEDAIRVDAAPGGVTVTVRYLASGPGADGVAELEAQLSKLAQAEPIDD